MQLKYIFGGAGSGKTHKAMLEATQRARNTGKALIYLTPEQFSMEAERLLCRFSKDGAVMQPQVLSFSRLGHHVFSREGRLPGIFMDEASRNMLVQRILLAHSEDLGFYARLAGKPGFAEGVSNAIKELAQAGLGPRDIRAYCKSLGGDGAEIFVQKLEDIAKLFELFGQHVNEKYIVAEAEAAFLPEKIAGAGFLEGCEVWVDGFTGFTEQEYAILGALMRRAALFTVCICIPGTHAATDYSIIKEDDPLGQVKYCVQRLTSLARDLGCKEALPVIINERPRFLSKELAHLERTYLEHGLDEYSGIVHDIRIYHVPSRYAEVELAAMQILRLVRDGLPCGTKLRYSDIAIECANPLSYEGELRSVLSTYDIPFFMDTRVPVHPPLVAMLVSAAKIAAYGYKHEEVFAFLKTGLMGHAAMGGVSRDEVDVLENYCLAVGIQERMWQAKTWVESEEPRLLYGRFDDKAMDVLREHVQTVLAPLLRLGKEAEAGRYARGVWEVIKPLYEGETDETLGQTLGLVGGMLEKLAEIMGDELVSAADFAGILEAGLGALDVGLIPPRLDQVVIGSIERSRLPDIAALFVLGANEVNLASSKPEIFTDADRASLAGLGLNLGADRRTKAFQEPYVAYGLLTQPRRLLVVSYLTAQEEGAMGKPRKPSALVERLHSIFPGLLAKPHSEEQGPTVPPAMLPRLGEALRESIKIGLGGLEPSQKALMAWYAENPDYISIFERMKASALGKTSRVRLAQHSLEQLYREEIIMSVSRLEMYTRCPFAYFTEYSLKLQPRKIFEADARDFGNFYHKVFEKAGHSLNGRSWVALGQDEISKIVDNTALELAPELGYGVMLKNKRNEYILGKMAGIAKRSLWATAEHVRAGAFEPKAYELSFGPERELEALVIDTPGGKIVLKGTIDRIDVFEQNSRTFIRIIDYKSGSDGFSLKDVRDGLQLQLMTYMSVALENGEERLGQGDIMPGGVFYFRTANPILDEDKLEGKQVDAEVLKEFKLDGLVVSEPSVLNAMEDGINGHSANIKGVYIKKDGSLGAKSHRAVDVGHFSEIIGAAHNKMIEIAQDITGGNIDVSPKTTLKGNLRKSPCDYCPYAGICELELRQR